MFCSQCGKKVLDSMLFCPFCGAQIIIPDQDAQTGPEAPAPEPVKAPETPARESETPPVFSFDLPEEAEAPTPAPAMPEEAPVVEDLFPWEAEETEAEETVPEPQRPMEDLPEPAEAIPEPVEDPPLDRRSKNAGNIVPGRRSRETYVPDKPLDRSAMFLDDADDFDAPEDPTDDYDDFEEALEREERRARRKDKKRSQRQERPRRPAYDEDDEDEDEDDEDRGFFMRHIRGIVGILLFLVLLAVLGIYLLSDAGQRSLARINATLPLRADVYKVIAYEHYQSGEYAQSGTYYERALARDPGNYDFAASAAMAYLSAGDNDRAAEMLRKCIQLKPEAVEPYLYLLNLYPTANSRPWDVAQLLKQGYEKTGDQRLEAAANGIEQR